MEQKGRLCNLPDTYIKRLAEGSVSLRIFSGTGRCWESGALWLNICWNSCTATLYSLVRWFLEIANNEQLDAFLGSDTWFMLIQRLEILQARKSPCSTCSGVPKTEVRKNLIRFIRLYPLGNWHIPPLEKENHLPKPFGKGHHVSFREGILGEKISLT